MGSINDEKEYDELISLAQEYGSNNEWDKAIENYERAFSIMIRIDDLLDMAIAYLLNNNSFRALNAIETVITAHPEDYRGYFYKGLYYEHLEDDQEALSFYLKAETLLKGINNSELFFKIGRIYDDTRKDDLAMSYYEKALSIDNDHFFANLNLGSIYESKNDLTKALDYTMKAYTTDNSVQSVCYNLGVIYAKMGKNEEALKYYLEETTKENPFPYVYYNLGIIYKDEYKDYSKAIEYYLLALKDLRKDSSVWYNLGCVHVLNESYALAYDCFKCAISLNDKMIEFMKVDEEIIPFVQSEYFDRLLKSK